ncbi:hypothetical protein HMPREF9370_2076 [Neisseria wadsworthii 9715]|uniref:Uncharacterized protein n=1 Tax=Neisseria wadsworthii 9715 TaxID=1030841 RepID=G4CST5_9NEIS|nr:hypothetical protein HMPREF9370_2076 [Neisseria wadsworthii 9715]
MLMRTAFFNGGQAKLISMFQTFSGMNDWDLLTDFRWLLVRFRKECYV